MTEADLDATVKAQLAAFTDLDRRNNDPVPDITDAMVERQRVRHQHFLEHDPDGAFVAVADDAVVGCGLALRRDSLWGLSLLVVDPAVQSTGAGRKLLDATLRYAEGCDLGVILSSNDHRAIRAYATSGLSLFPQVMASGKPTLDKAPKSVTRVRDASAADADFANEIDRLVRGAGRGPDHAWIIKIAPMYVVDDKAGRGYAYLRNGEVYLLAATDEDTATTLLWRCFAHAADEGIDATVEHITGEQQWAISAALDARLSIKPGGPVFWRGTTPPRAYIPSGAFL
ncbi:MAG TPA: GNAT family N-acetyltransferase [Mycobacteriales bacterium]|nr:GNAT family N-acetyltransferase [Mycobacteriales bacterium]